MRVVVLGVGNILLSDEGVGVHAVNELDRLYQMAAGVEILDGGTSGMDCLDQIADLDHLIIADCMRSKSEPGTIKVLRGDEIPAYFKTKLSPHQVGLSDVLATLNFHGIQPRNVVLVGVEPKSFATHMGLTDELSAVLPAVVETLVAELAAIDLAPAAKAA